MNGKVPCPRCGGKASPNARGYQWVHCRRCGGLVPINYRDDDGPYSDDPVQSAMANERGMADAGRVLRGSGELRGGL